MRTVIRLTTLPAALVAASAAFSPAHAARPAPSPVTGELHAPGKWTAARMRQAEANPLDLPERAARPAKNPPVTKAVVAKGHSKAPLKQIGRLYIQGEDGRLGTCTGTVVNTAWPGRGRGSGSLLLTAAHCLQEPSQDWKADSLVFVPDLDRKSTPHGLWSGYRTLMWSPWIKKGDATFDYAFVVMAARGSGTIQQRLNGQSLRFKSEPKSWVRLYGYAVEHYPRDRDYPEKGTVLRVCKGRIQSAWVSFRRFSSLKCDMSRGASGGPLITALKSSGYGRIIGVTSFRKQGEPVLHSAVFDKWTKDLFFRARTIKAPVQPPPQDIVRVS